MEKNNVLFAHVLEQNFEQWQKGGVEKNSVLFAQVPETNDEMKKNGFASSSHYGKELFICTLYRRTGRTRRYFISANVSDFVAHQCSGKIVKNYIFIYAVVPSTKCVESRETYSKSLILGFEIHNM